jgi:hypothetical protein
MTTIDDVPAIKCRPHLSKTFTFERSLAGSPRSDVEYGDVGEQSITIGCRSAVLGSSRRGPRTFMQRCGNVRWPVLAVFDTIIRPVST